MEAPHLLGGEGVGGSQRVESRLPERLIGVDVADPSDEGLVEEQRLQAG
jgi:hypothetical protein